MKKYIYNPKLMLTVAGVFFLLGILFNSSNAVNFGTSNLIGKISFIVVSGVVLWTTIGYVITNIIRKNKNK
ncbi:MAG: hypothetical protein ACOCVF_01560 [bacterium]